MYTDCLSIITNPVTGETRLLGPVGARAHLAEYKHMYDRVLDRLASEFPGVMSSSPIEQAREARLWDEAFKFEGWIQALETFLAGGVA